MVWRYNISFVNHNSKNIFFHDYIKNHYRLTAIDLSRQKELDADPKATQQIAAAGQLKNEDGIGADGAESMFILTILEKWKKRD